MTPYGRLASSLLLKSGGADYSPAWQEGLAGSLAGGAAGALTNLYRRHHHKEPGKTHGSILGDVLKGALIGGGIGGVHGLYKVDPHPGNDSVASPHEFFGASGQPKRDLAVPDWYKGEDNINPAHYLARFYDHVPGGWKRVRQDAEKAVDHQRKERGYSAVARPGERGSIPFHGGRADGADDFNDLSDHGGGPRTQLDAAGKRVGRQGAFNADTVSRTARYLSELGKHDGKSTVGAAQIMGDYPEGDKPINYFFKDKGRGGWFERKAEHALNQMLNVANGFEAADAEPVRRAYRADDAARIILGHEARHHYQGMDAIQSPEAVPAVNGSGLYIQSQPELLQALGQLKAETAYMTGDTIDNAADFRKVLQQTGVEDRGPEKLRVMRQKFSPEGDRMLNYMRTLRDEDQHKYNDAIQQMGDHDLFKQVVRNDADAGSDTKMASLCLRYVREWA